MASLAIDAGSRGMGTPDPACGCLRSTSWKKVRDDFFHMLVAEAIPPLDAVWHTWRDNQGHTVEAKKRGSKSVVRRDVVRLVTPGTLTEDTLLDARRNNYLLAIVRARLSSAGEDSRFALSWIDISTGEFRIAECDRLSLPAEIARLEPGEIIVSENTIRRLPAERVVPVEPLALGPMEYPKRWPAENWTLAFQGNVHELSDADAELLEAALTADPGFGTARALKEAGLAARLSSISKVPDKVASPVTVSVGLATVALLNPVAGVHEKE